jgi:hypothetical protein
MRDEPFGVPQQRLEPGIGYHAVAVLHQGPQRGQGRGKRGAVDGAVLAADQDMVRDAISVSLDGARRGDVFAKRYLEKIVQLPIALPRLSATDAEAYIGLLIVGRSMNEADLGALAAHVRTRRNAHQTPLLHDFDGLAVKPAEDDLALASQLAEGLSADRRSNPRQIKRLLNAFGVRESIARARGVTIPRP